VKNRTIPLSPHGGLTPHLTYCQHCGQQTGEITVGHLFWLMHEGERVACCYKKHKAKVCKRLGIDPRQVTLVEVGPWEQVPANDLCDQCKQAEAEVRQVVELGGIFFRCQKCGAEGAILGQHPIVSEVRESALKDGLIAKLEDPVGILLTDCPQCSEG